MAKRRRTNRLPSIPRRRDRRELHKTDPERFALVQRILTLFLTGEYSVRQLQRSNEVGAQTRHSRDRATDTFPYLQSTNPYPAVLLRLLLRYQRLPQRARAPQGAHEPMITEDEFDLIQVKLGRKGHPRNRGNFHSPYTGKSHAASAAQWFPETPKTRLFVPSAR